MYNSGLWSLEKAYFDGFQNCEFTSGSVAAPRSPKDAPRASGAMLREVTPVCTGLNSFLILSSACNVGTPDDIVITQIRAKAPNCDIFLFFFIVSVEGIYNGMVLKI